MTRVLRPEENRGEKFTSSCSEDQTVKLWAISTGLCLKTLRGHDCRVFSMSFSPNGQTLASSHGDATVKLWDVQTGQCLKTLENPSSGLLSIAFSPIRGASPEETGHLLASGSQDQTVKLWDVATGANLQTLKAESPYEGMNITGIRGLSEAQKASLRALGAQELPSM